MEQSRVYRHKLVLFETAVNSLEDALKLDFKKFSKTEVDVIKNGQIQKFEYCSELMWKTLQAYINEVVGEDVNGPKPAVKAALNNNLVDNDCYQILFEIIEARNKLAHLYDEKKFEEIYVRLKIFSSAFKKLIVSLKKN